MNKKTITIALAILFSVFTVAQNVPRGAKYWIKGNYTISKEKGKWVGKLYDISSKNINFPIPDTLSGVAVEDNYQKFIFSDVKCDQDLSELGAGLKFYKWTSTGWEQDSETANAKMSNEATSDMVVMLVLDCSNSLGNNFHRVQNSAINFINILFEKCPQGNVKIGVIAFNSMDYVNKNTLPIQSLTASSKDEITRFINELKMGSNTALYYSMDKASTMLEKYASSNYGNNSENLGGTVMVSFTDGYDNASVDENLGLKGVDFENPYFKHVNGLVHGKKINGKNLESYIIAINSDDADSRANGKFASLLKGVSSKDENFMMAKDFNDVDQKFREMGESLVKRWENLVCLVPPAHDGAVCWVLGGTGSKSNSLSAPADKSTYFLGASIGLGLSFCQGLDNFPIYLGGEAAYRINEKYMLGLYLTLNTMVEIGFGPMIILNTDNGNYMLGTGLNYRTDKDYSKGWEWDLRAGIVWDRFYTFLSTDFGVPKVGNDNNNHHLRSTIGLHFGYRF